MNYHFAYPSEILRPFIKQYWAIENCLKAGEQYMQRVVASGMPEIMLYIGHKPASDRRGMEEHFLVSGQQNDYYDLHISDSISIFSITFHPQGLSRLFNLPVSELMNQNIPLRYLNKSMCETLQQQLFDAETFEQRVQITERYLMSMTVNDCKEFGYKRISNAVDVIRKTGAGITIDTLAARVCLSRKQFEREFHAMIGISPKQYLRIIRFQSAIFLKSKDEDLSMTRLALDCGYYDQAHLTNEFKALSGLTPVQYFADCEAVSDFFG
jgi:AraC-like DNA-binding protein